MKNILRILVLGALILTNCAAPPAGPPVNRITRARVERFLIKGKTTKSQVLAEFGAPSNSTIMNTSTPTITPNAIPYETIAYTKVYSTFPMDVVSLIVQLDRKGVVIGYIFTGQGRVPGA